MRRMRIPMEVRGQLATRFEVLLPHLNERQQRLALAVEARLLGHGGVRAVARVAGVSETTVRRGVFELEAGEEPFPPGRARRLGGGRKPAARRDPALVPALLALVEPDERGDPMSPLRWTTKSLRHLAEELTRQGHPVSAPTVGRLLQGEGFSLQANAKTLEGAQHPDRDAQFRYLTRNTGWVNVGVDHDTCVFAVESIRRWWQARGSLDYPQATRLLITADAGGSNGYRHRVWKSELAALAAETGLQVTVCHFPPGTSKWNKIEHRLFSHITFNWRGRPLTSHEVVVKTIASTTTSSGLRVEAALDPGDYPTGVAISKERFDALPLQRHATHSAWNYTLYPHPVSPSTQPEPVDEQDGSARRRQAMLGRLADPRLTGITTTDLQQLAALLAPAQAARTQQRHAEQRGGRARRAAGRLRGRPLFDDAARLLLTLVYQRQVCSMTVLADLLEVTDTCIASLVHETREVLEDHAHNPGIASVRFATVHDLLAFLDQDLRPARTAIIHTLSAPALTGMSRQELHQLTQRLTPRQAAHAERRTHQRRGGPRQPGTRGSVSPRRSATANASC